MMKREMRRSDRRISEAEALELLQNGEYGILSTADKDGNPYGVPISYALDGGRIYFHGTNEGGRKTDNITDNSKACFTVVGETRVLSDKFSTVYHSVIAEGMVRILNDENEKKSALMSLIYKYSNDFSEKGAKYIDAAIGKVAVYEMMIESVSGKARRK